MNEWDRQFVNGMRSRGDEDKEIFNLLGIIDELEKQLAEIKEAGEFIGMYVEYLNKEEIGDNCDIILNPGGNEICVLAGAFRRLAETLKEVTCD